MDELKLSNTYHFADLVENYINGQSSFFNYSNEEFSKRATKFSKKTLLHLYIETTIWNFYNRDIRKNGGDYIDYIFFFKNLFIDYKINSPIFKNIKDNEESTDEKKLSKLNDSF